MLSDGHSKDPNTTFMKLNSCIWGESHFLFLHVGNSKTTIAELGHHHLPTLFEQNRHRHTNLSPPNCPLTPYPHYSWSQPCPPDWSYPRSPAQSLQISMSLHIANSAGKYIMYNFKGKVSLEKVSASNTLLG